MTTWRIDPASRVPPYEQLRDQVTAGVASGELAPGERLPTVRALAGTLGLAPNTVARAYRELEHAGVVETRGRSGTVVSGDRVERAAREAALAYADKARLLGLTVEDAQRHLLRAWERPRSS